MNKSKPTARCPNSVTELDSFLKCRIWFCGSLGQSYQEHSHLAENTHFLKGSAFLFRGWQEQRYMCSSSSSLKIRQKLALHLYSWGRVAPVWNLGFGCKLWLELLSSSGVVRGKAVGIWMVILTLCRLTLVESPMTCHRDRVASQTTQLDGGGQEFSSQGVCALLLPNIGEDIIYLRLMWSCPVSSGSLAIKSQIWKWRFL